jgi:hypothetical protein
MSTNVEPRVVKPLNGLKGQKITAKMALEWGAFNEVLHEGQTDIERQDESTRSSLERSGSLEEGPGFLIGYA